MRSQFSTLIALLVAALLVGDPSTSLAAAGGAPGGGGVGNSGPSGAREGRSPERKAESEYARGLRKRDNAWKHEAKAAEATTLKRRTKELKKAANDWQAAEKRYRKALKLKSKYHQAYSSLGYALRKQGRYPDAIAAYDRALAIQPRYAEAIEYRAEAYLGLDRIRKAVDSTGSSS